MRNITLLLIPLVMIFGIGLLLSLIPLPESIQPYQNLFAAVAAGSLFFIYFLGVAFYLINNSLGATKKRDQVFAQLGLDAGPYALFGRRYKGQFRRYRVDVYYLPGFRFYSPTLDIFLQTPVQTRFAVVNRSPLLSCRNCSQIVVKDPEFTDRQVFALDEEWIRGFLAESGARDAVLRLTNSEGAQLYLQPGSLWWRDHRWGFHPKEVETWLQSMAALAFSLENGPSPKVIDEPYALERNIHISRSLTTMIVVLLIGLAVLPLVLVCFGVTIFLLLGKIL